MPDFHPLAEIFPLMQGAEFDALVDDIKANGLREAIVLLDDQILDGRNRYRACEAANVEPVYQEWDNGCDPRAYVVSKNLHRRHLNESQRAMIAARLADAERGERNDIVGIPTKLTAQSAADLLNVDRSTVFQAKKVLNEGTKEEVAGVDQGTVSLYSVNKQLREKLPAAKRDKKRDTPASQVGKNPERIQRQQVNAEIWGRFRDALTNLTSLPLPADAVSIVRANDKTGLTEARLAKSIQYLKEFSDAWSHAK